MRKFNSRKEYEQFIDRKGRELGEVIRERPGDVAAHLISSFQQFGDGKGVMTYDTHGYGEIAVSPVDVVRYTERRVTEDKGLVGFAYHALRKDLMAAAQKVE